MWTLASPKICFPNMLSLGRPLHTSVYTIIHTVRHSTTYTSSVCNYEHACLYLLIGRNCSIISNAWRNSTANVNKVESDNLSVDNTSTEYLSQSLPITHNPFRQTGLAQTGSFVRWLRSHRSPRKGNKFVQATFFHTPSIT